MPVLAEDGTVDGTLDVESEQVDAFDPTAQSMLEECARAMRRLWQT